MTFVRHEVTNMRPGVTIVRPQEPRVTIVRHLVTIVRHAVTIARPGVTIVRPQEPRVTIVRHGVTIVRHGCRAGESV
ncbi:MAG TPA: hypothetical protein VFC82_06825 [Actinomycetaceae bacterium]|nr:hypothetical protein [Actinomycetaceae bacterium]